jgi:hypothetical protein
VVPFSRRSQTGGPEELHRSHNVGFYVPAPALGKLEKRN